MEGSSGLLMTAIESRTNTSDRFSSGTSYRFIDTRSKAIDYGNSE